MMVTADGDMWTALAVKVMGGGQVPVRDLRIYRLPATRGVVRDLREVFGLLGRIEIVRRSYPGHVITPQMPIANKLRT